MSHPLRTVVRQEIVDLPGVPRNPRGAETPTPTRGIKLVRHWTVRALVLLVALALSSPTAAGDAPQAPKLGGTPLPPAAAVPDDAPARSLPRTAAICQDATARRCWRAAREADCGATPGGRPYRLVIDSPADVAQALAQCSAALAETD